METRSRGGASSAMDSADFGKNFPSQNNHRRSRLMTYLPWFVALAQCFVIVALLMDPLRWECSKQKLCTMDCTKNHNQKFKSENTEIQDLERLNRAVDMPVMVPKKNDDRLFYNRVPKCGSSTMMDLIIEMSTKNNFTFSRAPEYMRFWIEEEWQRKFAKRVFDINSPMVYERHIHYLNFRALGYEQPVYINLVRDPLERLSSWYYFRRYQDGHIRDMPTKDRVRTYDECVMGNYSECVDPNGDSAEEGYFKLIPFFCGQEAYCRVPGQRALVQAIYNVKKYYTVVGDIERYSDFVMVLEHLLPKFFRGATSVFNRLAEEWKSRHKTTYKLPLSPEAKKIMESKLKDEYQFYHFLSRRFNALADNIKDEKNI